MKIGIYASMFGQDDPPTLESIESYIELAYALKVDLIDFRGNRGFESTDQSYLMDVKMQCLRYGLSVGYVASGGHFVGTDAELEEKLDQVRADVDVAETLGAPLIRVFCGAPLEDPEEQAREIRSFQQACDIAAEKSIAVGLQNHPSTGDDVLRIIDQTNRSNFTHILDTGQWVGSPARNQGVPDPGIDTYGFMAQTVDHASHIRAKFYKIDSGKEEWLDYERIIQIFTDANFNGPVSVVFEGKDVNDCDDIEVMTRAVAHLRDLLA